MLAATWPPIAPPIVRMTAFIPVATPVWSGRTASTIRLAIEANGEPDADAEQQRGEVDLPVLRVGEREEDERERS